MSFTQPIHQPIIPGGGNQGILSTLTDTSITSADNFIVQSATSTFNSTIVSNGGIVLKTVTKSSNYTIHPADEIIVCDTSSAGFTITLPSAASMSGQTFRIVNAGTNPLNINVAVSTDYIDNIQNNIVTLSSLMDYTKVTSNGTISTATFNGGVPAGSWSLY